MGIQKTPKRKQKKPKVLRYKLEPYSSRESTRFRCPSCGKEKQFSRYIDVVTGEYFGDNIGRCNREVECGYDSKPDLGKNQFVEKTKVDPKFAEDDSAIPIHSEKEVLSTLNNYDSNRLYQFLITMFDEALVLKTFLKYYVGTAVMWGDGATVFWQIDQDLDVRSGKFMLYDENGKRVKDPPRINWLPIQEGLRRKQCLFGTHLINYNYDTYHVVESEKTAIICALVSPDKMWIATGGLQMINEELFDVFYHKELIFYPDKGIAAEKWREKIESNLADFNTKINTSLNNVEELNEGDDLADLIVFKNRNKKT